MNTILSESPQKNISKVGVGSLIQIAATGPMEEIMKTKGSKNNEIPFMTSTNRHTQFQTLPYELSFDNLPEFGKKCKCTIQKMAPLLGKMYLEIYLPEFKDGSNWKPNVGFKMIKNVQIVYNENILQEYTTEAYKILMNLRTKFSKRHAFQEMIGTIATRDSQTIYIPILFWESTYFPLIALNYNLYINIEFAELNEVATIKTNNNQKFSCSLIVDYVYGLSDMELLKYKTIPLEYIVEEIHEYQEEITNTNMKIDLPFGRSVRALVISFLKDEGIKGIKRILFPNVNSIKYLFSNNDKSTRNVVLPTIPDYYNLIQPYYHSDYPSLDGIYILSFALNYSLYEPNGTMNPSELLQKTLDIDVNKDLISSPHIPQYIHITAISYNVAKFDNFSMSLVKY